MLDVGAVDLPARVGKGNINMGHCRMSLEGHERFVAKYNRIPDSRHF